MTRKLSILLVLVLFVLSFAGATFAANAKNAANGSIAASANISAPKVRFDNVDEGAISDGIGKPNTPPPAALGYQMLGTTTVGFTEFDRQSNERQQRQIAVGCGGNIHNVFIFRPFGGGDREIDYSTYVPGSAPSAQFGISPATGGYGAISVEQVSGKAVAAWHYTPTSPARRPFANAGRYATLLRLDRFPANRLSGCPGSVAEYSELPRDQDRCRGAP